MRNLEDAIFDKYGKHIKLSVIAKLAGMTQQTLYEINRKPTYNLTINNIDAIYRATKDLMGEGLKPWEYLSNCSNYCKENKVDENILRTIAIEKIRQETVQMESIHEEHNLSNTSADTASETAAEILKII